MLGPQLCQERQPKKSTKVPKTFMLLNTEEIRSTKEEVQIPLAAISMLHAALNHQHTPANNTTPESSPGVLA